MTVPPTAPDPSGRTMLALLAVSFAGGAYIGYRASQDMPRAVLIAEKEGTVLGWD